MSQRQNHLPSSANRPYIMNIATALGVKTDITASVCGVSRQSVRAAWKKDGNYFNEIQIAHILMSIDRLIEEDKYYPYPEDDDNA